MFFKLLNLLFKPTPSEKGASGERSIERVLGSIVNAGNNARILRNVYVPLKDGKTVEIDALFITPVGFFVIESKNMSGYIFGSEKNRNWTETLFAGKDFLGGKQVEKHHFYNPVLQNKAHINALRSYLEKDVKCISIIVFSGMCELKKINVTSEDTTVCYINQLEKNIGKYWNELPGIYSPEEIDRFNSLLYPLTKADEETKAKHKIEVYEKRHGICIEKEEKNETEEAPKCPWCGGKLVVRTAKHGPTAGNQFYGCSNFPECRYTRNIK